MSEKRRRIIGLHRRLRTQFPTIYPTALRFVRGADVWGWCQEGTVRGEQRLLIFLSKDANVASLQDTLFHEFAHAMEWRPEHQHRPVSHTNEWGLALARIWRWYTGEREE